MLLYPSKHGTWTWEELQLVAKALGYNEKTFYENISLEKRRKSRLKNEELELLLEGDTLYPHLHKTFNHQNGTYNIKVISKSIELLMHRYLSFPSLRMARVSFQTYEHTDHAGLEDRNALQAMQLCGKIMSPLKYKQIVCHMGRLVPDRLMLYEFLELIASADNIEAVKKELPEKKDFQGTVDDRNLYKLCCFEDELCTQEERYYRYLDQKYEESRRIIPVENSTEDVTTRREDTHQWVVPPLANPSVRKEMSLKNAVQSKMLKVHLESGSRNSSCGMRCTCEAGLVSSVTEKVKSDNLPIVITEEESITSTPQPILVKILPSIVTEEDIEDAARKIQNIQWDIATHNQNSKKRRQSILSRR